MQRLIPWLIGLLPYVYLCVDVVCRLLGRRVPARTLARGAIVVTALLVVARLTLFHWGLHSAAGYVALAYVSWRLTRAPLVRAFLMAPVPIVLEMVGESWFAQAYQRWVGLPVIAMHQSPWHATVALWLSALPLLALYASMRLRKG